MNSTHSAALASAPPGGQWMSHRSTWSVPRLRRLCSSVRRASPASRGGSFSAGALVDGDVELDVVPRTRLTETVTPKTPKSETSVQRRVTPSCAGNARQVTRFTWAPSARSSSTTVGATATPPTTGGGPGRVVVAEGRVVAGGRRVVARGRGLVVLRGAEVVVGAAPVIVVVVGAGAGAGEDVVAMAGVVVLTSGTLSGAAPCSTVEPGEEDGGSVRTASTASQLATARTATTAATGPTRHRRAATRTAGGGSRSSSTRPSGWTTRGTPTRRACLLSAPAPGRRRGTPGPGSTGPGRAPRAPPRRQRHAGLGRSGCPGGPCSAW